jgi:hypothetical protein
MRLERDRLIAVGRIIIGGDPPLWLVEIFAHWAPSVALDRHVFDKQPAKRAMRKRLSDVGKAAAFLFDVLRDTPTLEFLQTDGTRIEGKFVNNLQDLTRRADHAMASLSTTEGKTKAGRGPALVPNALQPRAFCAAIVAEVWSYFRSTEVAPKNREVAEAADIYWRICFSMLTGEGTNSKGWGNDPLNGWPPYFRQARTPTAVALRQELRRHLDIARVRAGEESAPFPR